MRIILLFDNNETVSSYQQEMIASIAQQVSHENLLIFNPPTTGLRDSRYDMLKFQLVYKLQYLIRHE